PRAGGGGARRGGGGGGGGGPPRGGGGRGPRGAGEGEAPAEPKKRRPARREPRPPVCSLSGQRGALLSRQLLRLLAVLEFLHEAERVRVVLADQVDVAAGGDLVLQAGGPVAGVDQHPAHALALQVG